MSTVGILYFDPAVVYFIMLASTDSSVVILSSDARY